MKTFVIYNGTEQIDYFILDGDYRHLNDVYINAKPDDKDYGLKQIQLEDLIYSEQGEYTPTQFKLTEWADEINDAAHSDNDWTIIECGMLP